MKRNLISLIILALLVVNLVLTGIMMFSVTSTNKKVAGLIGNIATVMNLELTDPGDGSSAVAEVSLADTEVYAIAGSMTIPLAAESTEDGQAPRQAYVIFNISFSLNSKHADYKKYGSAEAMDGKQELIKDTINSIVCAHTVTELQSDVGLENLKKEILKAVQEMYQSDFIYKVSISEVKYGL